MKYYSQAVNANLLTNFIMGAEKEMQKRQGKLIMTSNLTASMRWVTRLILTVACFVWYSPYVYAVVERVNQQPAMNQIKNYYPLGAELNSLRKRLQQTSQEIAASLNMLEKPQGASLYYPVDTGFNNLSKIKKLDTKKRQQMDATLQHFKSSKLSEQIIQRQTVHIQQYRKHMTELYNALEVIFAFGTVESQIDSVGIPTQPNAQRLEQQHALVKSALALLNFPLSRNPQSYSNDLDFIDASVRKIYTTQAEIDALIGADSGNYTATDSATRTTQLISDKVIELGADPLTLYTWVHDTIRWLPSYGVMQGADYTLQTEQGNAFDTASLLISLLRAAGHEARYRYGIVRAPVDDIRNWVGNVKNVDAATNLMSQGLIPQVQIDYGGAVEDVEFEHVWVEVKQGANWHALDPSFKQYTYDDGIDLENVVPFDAQGLLTQLQNSSTSNEAEGWVQGVDTNLIETELTNYQSQLETYLINTVPQATLSDVLGLQTINVSTATILAAAEPAYAIQLSTAVDQLPETLFHRFHFQVGSTIGSILAGGFSWGSEIFELNELTTNLVGKDMALSFRPATQADEDTLASYLPDTINGPEDLPNTLPAGSVNMVGELTLNGVVVKSTPLVTLGTLLKTRSGYEPPQGMYKFTENEVVTGQYQVIAMDMQGLSPKQLKILQTKLENTRTQLEAGNTASLTKHDVVGDILQAGIQGYMAMTYAADRIAAQSAGVAYYRQPSYGTFSTQMEVSYLITGVPNHVTFTGVVMDVDRVAKNVEEKANCYEGFVAFNRASGMRSSAYEHQIPEQLFSTDTEQAEGVSTSKALAIAMAEGQRIYTLTQANASELANVMIDDGARAEIQQALSLGLEVTVHQSPIIVNGWQGSGYMIIDAEYGIGAYKISGGGSGGVLILTASFLMITLAIVGLYTNPLLFVAASVQLALFSTRVQRLVQEIDDLDELDRAINEAAYIAVFATLTAFYAPLLAQFGGDGIALGVFLSGILASFGLTI